MNEATAISAFSALASEPRIRIVRALVKAAPNGLAAGDLAEAIGAPASSTSFHLSALERAGLLTSRRESRSIVYQASLHSIRELVLFLLEDCCGGQPDICSSVIAGIEASRSCGC